MPGHLNKSFCEIIHMADNFYFKCKQIIFQIVIVHQRGNFFWINSDNFQADKHLGDVPRAISKFSLVSIVDDYSNKFKVTQNVKRLLFDYKNSRFIECDRSLANRNLVVNGSSYKQDLKKNGMISSKLEYVTSELENMHRHYWLAGGTLLGWYRDCGIISHTKDVDLAIWSHEYDENILKLFMGNSIMNIWLVIGFVS